MSATKRLRADEAARKAGLKSTESEEGRKWLWKALNPADPGTAAIGIPTGQSNNISTLNYQSQYDITAPPGVTSAYPSFDCDLYLNHNPVIFGTAISYPSGSMDLSGVGTFEINTTVDEVKKEVTVKITPDDIPDKPVAMRTVQQLTNSQIDPRAFQYSNSLASKRVLYSQVIQKARLSYGSAHVIPTCSDLNNGGLITACQQVCEPKESMIDEANGIHLLSYNENDFPNIEDTIQNPQMYSARYNDGCYMPYKIRDPFNNDYVSSEREMTCRAPYVVTGVSLLVADQFGTVNEGVFTRSTTANATNYTVRQVPMTLTQATDSTMFTIEATTSTAITEGDIAATKSNVLAIRFDVCNLIGQRGYFYVSLNDESQNNVESKSYGFSNIISNSTSSTSYKQMSNMFNGPFVEGMSGAFTAGQLKAETNGPLWKSMFQGKQWFHLPRLITAWDSQGLGASQNPMGIQWVSVDTTLTSLSSLKALTRGTIPDMLEKQMCTVHMTGVSATAPIKLIMRMGVEILLTASSLYSPFKYISPEYDESAIKSYLRCTRAMRDAYYANAGGIGGQAEFIRAMTDLVEYGSPLALSRVLNQGGNYVSLIG